MAIVFVELVPVATAPNPVNFYKSFESLEKRGEWGRERRRGKGGSGSRGQHDNSRRRKLCRKCSILEGLAGGKGVSAGAQSRLGLRSETAGAAE